MLTWLDEHSPLPPGRTAMGPDDEVPGLVAAGGQVTPERLEEAYRKGIFPWFSAGQPVLWWSPDPRMVLPVADFKLSRSLRKTLRRFVQTPGNELRVDSAFDRVIRACADAPRDGQDGTWIGPALALRCARIGARTLREHAHGRTKHLRDGRRGTGTGRRGPRGPRDAR